MQHRKDDDWIRASDLAQMGVCERQVRFGKTHGSRRSPEQVAAAEMGAAAHAAFFRESVQLSTQQKRRPSARNCIAAFALGDGPDAQTLRALRSQVLAESTLGRMVIKLYDALSPVMVLLARAHPGVLLIMSGALRAFARVTTNLPSKRTE